MEIGVGGRRARDRCFEEDEGTTSMEAKRQRMHDGNKDSKQVVSSPEMLEIGSSGEIVSQNDDLQRPEISAEDRCSVDADQYCLASASCCSSNGSRGNGSVSVGILILQEVNNDFESPANFSCDDRIETTSHKEDPDGVAVDSETNGSDAAEESPAVESHRRSISKTKKPTVTEAELENFFSAAEKEFHNEVLKYTKKYNFDFVKEEPLEGRYEWDSLQK